LPVSDEEENQEPESLQEQQLQAALKPENVRQMKIAIATIATCIAKSISETDGQLEQRFVGLLDRAYDNYRENSDADPQHVLEVIHWTREMLKGWNPVPGRKESIFGDGS
jgi:hypothetical protein